MVNETLSYYAYVKRTRNYVTAPPAIPVGVYKPLIAKIHPEKVM